MTTNCIPGGNTTTNPGINVNPAFGLNAQNCYPQSYIPQGYLPQNFAGTGFRPFTGIPSWSMQGPINPALCGPLFGGFGMTQPWNGFPSIQNAYTPFAGWSQIPAYGPVQNWGQNWSQNWGQNWNMSPFAGIQSPFAQNLYTPNFYNQYLASCGVNCLPGTCIPGMWNNSFFTPWNFQPWNVQPITGTTPFAPFGVQPITGTTPFTPGNVQSYTNVQPITGTTPFVGSGWNTSSIPNNFVNGTFGATNFPTPILGTNLVNTPLNFPFANFNNTFGITPNFTFSNIPFNTFSNFGTSQNVLNSTPWSTPFAGITNPFGTIPNFGTFNSNFAFGTPFNTFGNFPINSFTGQNLFTQGLFNQTPFVNGATFPYATGIQNFASPLNTFGQYGNAPYFNGQYTNGLFPTNGNGYPTNFVGYPTNFVPGTQGAYPFNVVGNEAGNVALAREAA